MKNSDEFSKTGFLPNRSFLWNISISADTEAGGLKALEVLNKLIKSRRNSAQIIEADYWLELDKLKCPSSEWLEHLHRTSLKPENLD